MDKAQQRATYRQRLATQLEAERVANSRLIADQVCQLASYQAATTLFSYVANAQEVDTAAIIQRAWRDGKRVAVPRITGELLLPKWVHSFEELAPGPYGLMEPPASAETVDTSELDLVLVPGLAFTRGGARLGRGGGYFDRWLATLPAPVPTIGLAFAFQLAEELPEESHDMRMQQIISR